MAFNEHRVVIPMTVLEELDDIKLFDAAKAANSPSIPIDEAFDLIEKQRSKK